MVLVALPTRIETQSLNRHALGGHVEHLDHALRRALWAWIITPMAGTLNLECVAAPSPGPSSFLQCLAACASFF